jgi:hypothetical protein
VDLRVEDQFNYVPDFPGKGATNEEMVCQIQHPSDTSGRCLDQSILSFGEYPMCSIYTQLKPGKEFDFERELPGPQLLSPASNICMPVCICNVRINILDC